MSDATRRREYDSQRKCFGGGSSSSWSSSKPNTADDDPFADYDDEIPNSNNSAGAGAQQSAYSWAWNFFTNQASGAGAANNNHQQQQQQQQTRQETESQQFGDVFEEMLREEGMADPNGTANNRFWGMLGGASGGALGFIVANVPGLLAGAVAGNRLGAVRDAKGKSVYAVFQVSAAFGGERGAVAGVMLIKISPLLSRNFPRAIEQGSSVSWLPRYSATL